MLTEVESWPYLPTLARLGLALAIGLFIGIERERRHKEAGLRTFAFASALGAIGGLLGESYSLLALGLVGVLVVFLNVETIRTAEGAEITTSAALLVTAFTGVLAGLGHTFTPSAIPTLEPSATPSATAIATATLESTEDVIPNIDPPTEEALIEAETIVEPTLPAP